MREKIEKLTNIHHIKKEEASHKINEKATKVMMKDAKTDTRGLENKIEKKAVLHEYDESIPIETQVINIINKSVQLEMKIRKEHEEKIALEKEKFKELGVNTDDLPILETTHTQ